VEHSKSYVLHFLLKVGSQKRSNATACIKLLIHI
jgi:hypothetical protein